MNIGRLPARNASEVEQGLSFRENFKTQPLVEANGGVVTGAFGPGMKIDYSIGLGQGNYVFIAFKVGNIPTGSGAATTRIIYLGTGSPLYTLHVISGDYVLENSGTTSETLVKGGAGVADEDIINILFDLDAGTMKARVLGFAWTSTIVVTRAEMLSLIVNESTNATTLLDWLEVWQSDEEFTDDFMSLISGQDQNYGDQALFAIAGKSNIFEWPLWKQGADSLQDRFGNLPALINNDNNIDLDRKNEKNSPGTAGYHFQIEAANVAPLLTSGKDFMIEFTWDTTELTVNKPIISFEQFRVDGWAIAVVASAGLKIKITWSGAESEATFDTNLIRGLHRFIAYYDVSAKTVYVYCAGVQTDSDIGAEAMVDPATRNFVFFASSTFTNETPSRGSFFRMTHLGVNGLDAIDKDKLAHQLNFEQLQRTLAKRLI